MLPSQRRLAFAQAVEADLRVQEDIKLASSSRYKDICHSAIKISTRAVECGEAFQFAVEQFDVVMQEVEKILNIKPLEETQVFALSRHGANGSESDYVVEGVDSDENQPNTFAGSMKGGEDVQGSTPNTFSSIQCRPPECCPLQFPTQFTQGLHSFGTNSFIGYTYQPPNVSMCQQSDFSMYQLSNFFTSQHGFPSHIHSPQAMDTEDKHPQAT
uniref:Uncharacterized protein n=2 Tax=Davidia involucrata TaxID=16924 RepID=A0A5B6YYD8_DAVIN